ncbi:MAG: hypothetical protein V1790_04640 [Planctomycetota bacterium]
MNHSAFLLRIALGDWLRSVLKKQSSFRRPDGSRTTTKTGLTVRAALDPNRYETGIEVSDEQLARVNWTPAQFHGEWNYTIRPKK